MPARLACERLIPNKRCCQSGISHQPLLKIPWGWGVFRPTGEHLPVEQWDQRTSRRTKSRQALCVHVNRTPIGIPA
jgi:hypothetical protein